MQTLATILAAIPASDKAAMVRARQHLESLAVQLAGMPGLQGELRLDEKALIVLCADHGVWQEGVTVSPKAVNAIQAANMVQANTGVCVLAAQAGAKVDAACAIYNQMGTLAGSNMVLPAQ